MTSHLPRQLRQPTFQELKIQQQHMLWEAHPFMLRNLSHTCQFCGKKGLGQKPGGKYQPYNFHHADSEAYGNEEAGLNYFLLCKRCHWLVHLLGGEPVLKKGAVRRQNARAKRKGRGYFPNTYQRLFNQVCWYDGSLFGLIGFVLSAAMVALLIFMVLI